jgi:hypothetical protein
MRRVIARSHRRNDVGNDDGEESRMISCEYLRGALCLLLGLLLLLSLLFSEALREARGADYHANTQS